MQADDAWGAVAELAASQHGAFHRRQAAEHHLSNRRLARAVSGGHLLRATANVFVIRGAPASWRQQLMINGLSGAIASHRAAAALHGFDGCKTGVVEVTVQHARTLLTSDAIVHHWRRLAADDVTIVDGIPCANAATTLCQLGAVVHSDRVEQALDSALRDGVSARWIEQTLDRLWRPGKSGVGVLRSILDDPRRSDALPDSFWERLIQRLLTVDDLPTPTLQCEVVVVGPDGQPKIRRIDLGFEDVRLGIAGHSREHHWSKRAIDADHQRDLEIAAIGWELLYVTWAMTQDPEYLVDAIRAVYLTRRAQLSVERPPMQP